MGVNMKVEGFLMQLSEFTCLGEIYILLEWLSRDISVLQFPGRTEKGIQE